jgi:hypothetical protein
MSRSANVRRLLALLRRIVRNSEAHGWDKRAEKYRAIERSIQDQPVKPTVITFPGVAAARSQSERGGIPGDPHAGNPGAGWCLMFVRLCFGIAKREDDAIGAWAHARHKHPQTNAALIPRGYPVFWAGGSSGHGHIAVSAGDGACWSTDIRRTGFFDKVAITEIHAEWGLTLLGWTEDLNGATVPAEKRS